VFTQQVSRAPISSNEFSKDYLSSGSSVGRRQGGWLSRIKEVSGQHLTGFGPEVFYHFDLTQKVSVAIGELAQSVGRLIALVPYAGRASAYLL
jgi:hypothetical protein